MAARKKKYKNKVKKRKPSLDRLILNIFKKNPKKQYSYKQLTKALKRSADKEDVIQAIGLLIEKGKLVQTERNKLNLPKAPLFSDTTCDGVLEMTNRGFAFVIAKQVNQDIFIHRKNLGTALDGDVVRVNIAQRRRGKNLEGKVVAILERAQEQFIGTFRETKDRAWITPDHRKYDFDILLPEHKRRNALDGDKVLVKVSEWPTIQLGTDRVKDNPVGEVVAILGETGSMDVEMTAILIEHGFPMHFPDEALQETSRMPSEITDEVVQERKDFRGVTTFTIDPADAKDFDDALSVRELDNGHWEIGIHIADVSHYVQVGSALDKEAAARGTSVYLVDRVLPMLPERLSNELCSLRPKEDKLCFSAVFEMDDQARVIDQWFGRTVIHSDHRFTYQEAQKTLDRKKGKFYPELRHLDHLAGQLRKARYDNGSIAFETTELIFELNDKGEPLGIKTKERLNAHLLIEDFMLLANKSVARWVSEQTAKRQPVPFVYRVHDNPDEEKLTTFAGFAANFGYIIDRSSPKNIALSLNNMMRKLKGRDEQDILEKLAIRTMAKAYYSTDNIGHYGLAFEYYTHFTSPIRRYPDILAHRVLEHCLKKAPALGAKQLEAHCNRSSVMERRAIEAERSSTKYMQVVYMSQKIGEDYDGIISGVTDWGIFVEIIENKCEGLVKSENLPDDLYKYHDREYALIGIHTRRKFQFGDHVRIRVVKADLEKRTLDFELVD